MKVANRFKGLDLIDKVSEELWTDILNIVQEAVIKSIPKKKKCNKAKWLSEETLQIALKRETKGKGEKERYTHSVQSSCPTLCDAMDCSTPGLPVHHHLLEFTQTHVH